LRLAIFGGTFDPIHDGHLRVAAEAARVFSLDRVLFVPASRPPHKTGATSAGYEDRVQMAGIACRRDPRFVVSRLEAGQDKSYTIHTIRRVKETLAPGDEIFFLIGADAFAEIRTWHRWQDVVREVDFIVVSRPGHQYSAPEGARVRRLETLDLPVSSSAIRARLARGDTPEDVPGGVLDYIRSRGLYRC
jgi:nicotinate-nucleotide adenylyltransferase